ncbi:Chromatin structure-remodeling complex subunit sfh1 [Leucoagaricus sp. SymC.cos]|nr:Chromatin structure-remodeling complex subunit sfh1 [Leucoagaricus sp. SymC.cos]
MADGQNGASSSSFPATAGNFGTMTDAQLRQAINHITSAANATYVAPAPRPADPKAYMKNVHTWSAAPTPPPKTPASAARPARTRQTRAAPTYTQPNPYIPQPVYTTPLPLAAVPTVQPNPPRPPLPSTPQALQSTYASRLRTGTTLLMQPIFTTTAAAHSRTTTRRGGVVNYADPGSGDEFLDAGAIDSDDSDFVASGGTRTAVRQSRSGRMGAGMSVFNSAGGPSATPNRIGTPQVDKNELDQSYLGQMPLERFIKPRIMQPTPHEYPTPDALLQQGAKRTSLIPIRVEFETETHRIRDCFAWNVNEELIKPETFATIFCNDLDLPATFRETVAAQMRAQIEEHEGVASMELGQDGAPDSDDHGHNGDELPECRVILSIDVQIANHHLMDHIEWDLLSPLTPEAFSQKLCMELGLSGEAIPLVAHAVHEELMKHKKDAIEWGVIGGEREIGDDGGPRDRSGFGLVKDKTGLGLGWGRAPKDGRGPKTLRSVWRDWQEADEFRTKFEELTAEEVERREIERERASRRLRRETSKFQSTRSRRR